MPFDLESPTHFHSEWVAHFDPDYPLDMAQLRLKNHYREIYFL
jgi:hypothetical protein